VNLDLQGKVAVVTGSSTGIGLAVCEALAAEGTLVVGGARHDPERNPSGVEHVQVDLATPSGPRRLVDHAIVRHGRLDVVVNNAGMGRLSGGFADEDDDRWSRTFELNLMAAVRAMRAALPHLAERGGAIINIASINARMPSADIAAYSACKAALLSAGKAVATEYGRRGIRVITVSPGQVSTRMWLGPGGAAEVLAAQAGITPEEVVRESAAGIPRGRFTSPEEVAACVAFLASPVAAAVSGVELLIDGGLTPTM
jgi:NAD(P)-dependent dehydrogenase (short-subunit alcohol dehydrogenase family)